MRNPRSGPSNAHGSNIDGSWLPAIQDGLQSPGQSQLLRASVPSHLGRHFYGLARHYAGPAVQNKQWQLQPAVAIEYAVLPGRK